MLCRVEHRRPTNATATCLQFIENLVRRGGLELEAYPEKAQVIEPKRCDSWFPLGTFWAQTKIAAVNDWYDG
jgi:hypothetical protein